MILSAFSLFFCWLRPSWQRTILPVGMCMTCTAESVVFTPCPPGPPERQTSMRRSSGFSSKSTSSASGKNRDGRGGSVDAALRFRRGHALHAMHAAFVAKLAENRFRPKP